MASQVLKNLSERRVPQVLAIYAGASWGVIEFISFLEERYLFSPHWTDITLLLLVMVLPSVAIFTYNHGRPGADEWVRSEKVAIPANLVIALGVVVLLFWGKELGAVTTTITVVDENGAQVERVVPKSEFRKRLALFHFEVPAASDTADAWLRHGVPIALDADLAQDVFLDLRSPPHLRTRLREVGYADGRAVPVALQRRIAQEMHLDYFVNGEVSTRDGALGFTVSLFETRRGRMLHQRSYSGTDLFALVDQASVQLKRDLGVPARHIEEVQDLPVEALLTSSLPVYRHFADAQNLLTVHDDWAGAAALLERAVGAEPSFAYAQYMLFRVRLLGNQAATMAAPLQAAMDHLYRLNERVQYMVKSDFYAIRQEPDKAFAVAQMWAELFPDDVQAHMVLAQFQIQRDTRDLAIRTLERVLEIDPAQHEMLKQIAGLHQGLGQVEQARARYEEYARRFPEDRDVFLQLGNSFRNTGDFQQARSSYERTLVIDPGYVEAKVRLAALDSEQGEFAAALRGYEAALEASRTAEERSRVYHGLFGYYERLGQSGRALEYRNRWIEEMGRFQAPFMVIQTNLMTLDAFARASQPAQGLQVLEALAAQLAPPFDKLAMLGEMQLYLELEQPDRVAAAITGVEQLIREFSAELLRADVAFARGRMHEMRGEWQAALAQFEEEARLRPTDTTVPAQKARVYRKLGQHRRSEELFLKTLAVHPFHARTHYELGQLYQDMGNHARAREHLQKAVTIWAGADPGHRFAQLARNRLAEAQVLAGR